MQVSDARQPNVGSSHNAMRQVCKCIRPQIIEVGNVVLWGVMLKTRQQEQVLIPLIPCNQAMVCLIKPQERHFWSCHLLGLSLLHICHNLRQIWGQEKGIVIISPMKGDNEPKTRATTKWFERCHTKGFCQHRDLGAILLSPSLMPSTRVWLSPLKHVIWQLSLILAGNSSPGLSRSLFLITFDFSSEKNSCLWSYFYGNFNESLGMTLITEDLKCLQIVFSFLLNASHTFLFTVKC